MAAQKCGLLSERVSVSVFFSVSLVGLFCNFFGGFYFFFITFLKEVLASLFSCGTFFVGVRKKDFEENNQTKKEKKKIMRSR